MWLTPSHLDVHQLIYTTEFLGPDPIKIARECTLLLSRTSQNPATLIATHPQSLHMASTQRKSFQATRCKLGFRSKELLYDSNLFFRLLHRPYTELYALACSYRHSDTSHRLSLAL